MKEEWFWQIKFALYVFHILKKVCLVKVAMSIFETKTTKYFHLVTPKNMSYLQFNSISFAQLFHANKYLTLLTVISDIKYSKIAKFTTSGILGINKRESFHRGLLQKINECLFLTPSTLYCLFYFKVFYFKHSVTWKYM